MTEKKGVRVDAGALDLLNREPPEGYLEKWAELLAQAEGREAGVEDSVVVFRIGAEWLGLPCQVFREFTPTAGIHRIPHRDDPVLLGITSIRGELHLAVSLHSALEIEECAGDEDDPRSFRRMAVLSKEGEVFVAPVDEVYGLHRIQEGDLAKAPVTVEKASSTHTLGTFQVEGRAAALLDQELLFCNLRRHVG